MAERSVSHESDSVDLAINQVLSAERDARAAVEVCQEEARRILAEAEEYGRRISQRTERRVKAAHRTADAAVERALQGLMKAEGRAATSHAAEANEERLGHAVDLLVDEMVGASP